MVKISRRRKIWIFFYEKFLNLSSFIEKFFSCNVSGGVPWTRSPPPPGGRPLSSTVTLRTVGMALNLQSIVQRFLPFHSARKFGEFEKFASIIYREAAVLIPLVIRDEGDLAMLLTKRSDNVTHHKGEVSFPGGSRERGDATPVDTAMRETFEEIGLPRSYCRNSKITASTVILWTFFCEKFFERKKIDADKQKNRVLFAGKSLPMVQKFAPRSRKWAHALT